MLSLQNIGHNRVPEEFLGIETADDAVEDNYKKDNSEKIKIKKLLAKSSAGIIIRKMTAIQTGWMRTGIFSTHPFSEDFLQSILHFCFALKGTGHNMYD